MFGLYDSLDPKAHVGLTFFISHLHLLFDAQKWKKKIYNHG